MNSKCLSLEREKLLNAQKDLLSSINLKLLKLCETLRLPERIVETILFILALQSHTCRPYLIISAAAAALPLWESEFAQLAPSVNIVVYNGTKDVRSMIQTVEFYDEGGCIIFQVLISHSDAVIEDLDTLYCIGWEAIIVDECQKSRVSKHFEQFRNIPSDFRLLLFSGPLKDNLVDYLNTLSFLDPKGQENPVDISKFDVADDNDRLAILKERLAFYVAYERKLSSLKFQEYWIPAQLSNVQLDQYCNILMSNSDALHSISKVDHVGALSGLLNSARKCCDHPYLIDNSLASSPTKDLSLVEKSKFEVNASGKLRLLDKILQNIKTRGLKWLILGAPISQAKLGSMCLSCSGTIMNDAVQGLHVPPMPHNTYDVDDLKMLKLGEKEKLLNAQKDLLSSINLKLLKL